jgi:four helix bundle protein
MSFDADGLKARSKQFALRVIKLTQALPNSTEGRVMGNQLLRCATSVGANYRAACCARSQADFVSKIGVALEEADESAYWLELMSDSGVMSPGKVSALRKEAEELSAILAASRITASKRRWTE